MVGLTVVVTLIFAAGAFMTYRERGWYWVSVGLVCGALLGLGGIVEALIFRVRLTDDALLVTDLRGTRQFLKSEIRRVEQAKGSPTYIVLNDGRGVKLPPVGYEIGNSIRGWLKYRAG